MKSEATVSGKAVMLDDGQLRLLCEAVVITIVPNWYAMATYLIDYIDDDGVIVKDARQEKSQDLTFGELGILEQSLKADGYELDKSSGSENIKLWIKYDEIAQRLWLDSKFKRIDY